MNILQKLCKALSVPPVWEDLTILQHQAIRLELLQKHRYYKLRYTKQLTRDVEQQRDIISDLRKELEMYKAFIGKVTHT